MFTSRLYFFALSGQSRVSREAEERNYTTIATGAVKVRMDMG